MAEERARTGGGTDDAVGGNATAAPGPANEFDMEPDESVEHAIGESFRMEERLVVAPAGRLRLRCARQIREGDFVVEGEPVAEILTPSGERVVVGAPCDGWVMGFLLHDGFPVRTMEPFMWLRPSDHPIGQATSDSRQMRNRQGSPGHGTGAEPAVCGSLSEIEVWFTQENGERPEPSELSA